MRSYDQKTAEVGFFGGEALVSNLIFIVYRVLKMSKKEKQ